MKFSDFWKAQNGYEIEKSSLTEQELLDIQKVIAKLQKQGMMATKIIEHLQKMNAKLREKWKAERAYWTEVKRDNTIDVADKGDMLEIEKYKVILSPNPCEICIQKTNNGKKIFSQEEVDKTGYGEFVPWHPNCYCICIPVVD